MSNQAQPETPNSANLKTSGKRSVVEIQFDVSELNEIRQKLFMADALQGLQSFASMLKNMSDDLVARLSAYKDSQKHQNN